jgi:hypothetical protein
MHEEYSKKRLRTSSISSASSSAAFGRGSDAGRSANLSTQGAVPARKAIAS